MKVLIKSAWGSDESTKAAFAFLHANAFAEAGHEVEIFLRGEAVNLMRRETMNAVRSRWLAVEWARDMNPLSGNVC